MCKQCLDKFYYLKAPFCTKCGRPLPAERQELAKICRVCQKFPPQFDRGFSVCLYEGVLKECLHKFKYQGKTALKKTFGRMVSSFINENILKTLPDISEEGKKNLFDCIIPVPLHITRMRERGFNQSELLAIEVCKSLDISLKTNILKRKRFTKSQILLTKKQRRKNVRDAFIARTDKTIKSVILLDDIMTTGSTLDECSRTLRQAGIEFICAVVVARTLHIATAKPDRKFR